MTIAANGFGISPALRARRAIGVSVIGVLTLGGFGFSLSAQVPVPTPPPPSTQLSWDHDGIDVDGFALVVDGMRQDLGAVARQPDGSYAIPFPTLTRGNHILVVEAYNVAGRAASGEFQVRVVALPAQPRNLRVVPALAP